MTIIFFPSSFLDRPSFFNTPEGVVSFAGVPQQMADKLAILWGDFSRLLSNEGFLFQRARMEFLAQRQGSLTLPPEIQSQKDRVQTKALSILREIHFFCLWKGGASHPFSTHTCLELAERLYSYLDSLGIAGDGCLLATLLIFRGCDQFCMAEKIISWAQNKGYIDGASIQEYLRFCGEKGALDHAKMVMGYCQGFEGSNLLQGEGRILYQDEQMPLFYIGQVFMSVLGQLGCDEQEAQRQIDSFPESSRAVLWDNYRIGVDFRQSRGVLPLPTFQEEDVIPPPNSEVSYAFERSIHPCPPPQYELRPQ